MIKIHHEPLESYLEATRPLSGLIRMHHTWQSRFRSFSRTFGPPTVVGSLLGWVIITLLRTRVAIMPINIDAYLRERQGRLLSSGGTRAHAEPFPVNAAVYPFLCSEDRAHCPSWTLNLRTSCQSTEFEFCPRDKPESKSRAPHRTRSSPRQQHCRAIWVSQQG